MTPGVAVAGVLGVSVLGCGLYWGAALTSHVRWLRRPLGVVDRVADDGAVALTFDDGPHPEGTPAVLEVLAAHGAHATFFLSGEQVERFPEVARAVADAGHEVGLHCHRHAFTPFVGPRRAADDLRRAAEVVERCTGTTPRYYRPPFGWVSTPALLAARRLGCRTVLWSRQGGDWREGAMRRTVAHGLAEGLRGGEVLLMHDSDVYSAPDCWRRTVEALPDVLGAVERAGLRVTLLDGSPAAGPAAEASRIAGSR